MILLSSIINEFAEKFFCKYNALPSHKKGYVRVSQTPCRPGTRKASAIDYNFTVHETLPESEQEYRGLRRSNISGLRKHSNS